MQVALPGVAFDVRQRLAAGGPDRVDRGPAREEGAVFRVGISNRPRQVRRAFELDGDDAAALAVDEVDVDALAPMVAVVLAEGAERDLDNDVLAGLLAELDGCVLSKISNNTREQAPGRVSRNACAA